MAIALDVVKDVYRRFGEGDISGFLSLCADNIEWVVNGPESLEKCRAYKGRDGVQEFLRILDTVVTRCWPRERYIGCGRRRGKRRCFWRIL